jgi:hypothetical protein
MRDEGKRMGKRILLVLVATTILMLGAGTASSLVVSAELNGAESDFASSGTLTAGDTIVLDIRVSNPALDTFRSMFVSLVFDSTELQYSTASLFPILVEESCTGSGCTPGSLIPLGISAGQLQKPNDPESLGTGAEAWVNSLVHTTSDPAGASGPGGEIASRLTFEVLTGLSSVTLSMALTPGDTITDENLDEFAGPLSLNGIVVTPEPGTAVLLGLGLLGLGRQTRTGSPRSV